MNNTATRPKLRAGDAEAGAAVGVLGWLLTHSTLRAPHWVGSVVASTGYLLIIAARLRARSGGSEMIGLPLRGYFIALVVVRATELAWDGLGLADAVYLGSSVLLALATVATGELAWAQLVARATAATRSSWHRLQWYLRVLAFAVGSLSLARGLTVLPLMLAIVIARGDNGAEMIGVVGAKDNTARVHTGSATLVALVLSAVVFGVARWTVASGSHHVFIR